MTDGLKTTLKRAIQKTAKATDDLTRNLKITDKIIKVLRNSQQNNSETVPNGHDKEISKERYIYLQKKDRKLLMN